MSEKWEIPVYWYIERMIDRPGGKTVLFQRHWSKPSNAPSFKTRKGKVTTRDLERLLWPYQWEVIRVPTGTWGTVAS